MKKQNDVLKQVIDLEKEANASLLEDRIPGSFTSEEYAAETGRSPITVAAILRNLIAAGKLKRVKIPKMTAVGKVMRVSGYVLADKNAKESK